MDTIKETLSYIKTYNIDYRDPLSNRKVMKKVEPVKLKKRIKDETICTFEAYKQLKQLEKEFLVHKDSIIYRHEILDCLNQEFCFILEGSFIIFINKTLRTIKKYNKLDFLANFGNYKIINPDHKFDEKDGENKKGKNIGEDYEYVSCADFWLKSPGRIEYFDVNFSEHDEPGIFNMYIPEFLPDLEQGDVAPLLDHILTIWCKKNGVKYEYTIKLLAHMIQKPFVKTCISLLLSSKEGSGKGVVIEKLLEYFGMYFKSVRNSDALGNFNSIIADAFILFFDELNYSGSSESKAAMKRLITESILPVTQKGKEAKNIKSHCNIIVATNNSRYCNAEAKSRRNYPLELDDKYSGVATPESIAYFTKIKAVKAIHFIYYLKYNVDISNFNPREFEITEELKNQMFLSLTALQAFWHHILSDPLEDMTIPSTTLDSNLVTYRFINSLRLKEDVRYTYTDIYDYFTKFVKFFTNKYSKAKDVTHNQFFQNSWSIFKSIEIKRKNIQGTDKRVKIGTFVIGSITTARKELCDFLGFDIFTLY